MIDLFPRDTGALTALLAVEDCRRQCRIDHADEDAELLGYAAAAQAWVEAFTGLRLTPREAAADVGCWAQWRVLAAPLIAVDAISYLDADGALQVLPAAAYATGNWLGLPTIWLRSGVIAPAIAADSSITIGMRLGYGAGECPADLRAACLLLVGHMYRNREAVVTGTIATELPLAVESLCIRHRLVSLA